MSSSRTADQNGISDFVQNHQKPLFSIPYLEEPLGEVGGRGLVSFRLIHSLNRNYVPSLASKRVHGAETLQFEQDGGAKAGLQGFRTMFSFASNN
ncbi:hypothetical protein Y032_0082g1540 [Ancylostoma ceylanicum]|uniref:Uncharacterized protein n=1 Tax=Ancylostoma ceylanicum TaxID=53326 RepID=A0A016TRH5_9BILA|nr:hypothetical protein Y032_0082g1540 [Ancylostoma ceylanicum]